MKNIFKNIAFLILIFNCYSATAQIQQEQLVGTWGFDYESSMVNMDENAKKVLAKSPTLQGRLEGSYRSRQIILATDGSYSLHLPDGKQVLGTWELNTVNGATIMVHHQNQIENLSIVMLSATALVLKPIIYGNVKPMFSTWYFTKI